MSTNDSMLTREEAIAEFDLAFNEMIRLSKSGEHFRMSIPADPSRDSDLIIAAALDAGATLADALESSP